MSDLITKSDDDRLKKYEGVVEDSPYWCEREKILVLSLRAAKDAELAALRVRNEELGGELTAAWMIGYHKRDDEVRLLRERNDKLEKALKSADHNAFCNIRYRDPCVMLGKCTCSLRAIDEKEG